MTLECDLPTATRSAPHYKFPDPPEDLPTAGGPQSIVLAGGCFWCVEAVYRQLDGVLDVTSGYAGDQESTANYEAVCSGRTQHAEVIKIDYDPARISLGRLLKVYFSAAHDPTRSIDRATITAGSTVRRSSTPARTRSASPRATSVRSMPRKCFVRRSRRRSSRWKRSIAPRPITRTTPRGIPTSRTSPVSRCPRSRRRGSTSRTS
jgi:methionine-S-sulfoxide reductase